MSNWNINGMVPKDQAYSNLTVDNTFVVRGKQFVQELDVVSLTVADMSTLNDVIVQGDQEIDGTLHVAGVAQFDSAVSIPVTQTELTLGASLASGTAYVIRQNNVVNLIFSVVAIASSVSSGTTLFTVPASDIPALDVFLTTYSSSGVIGANGGVLKVDHTTGDVTNVGIITTGESRVGNISWVALQ